MIFWEFEALYILIMHCWGTGFGSMPLKLILYREVLWLRSMGVYWVTGLPVCLRDHMECPFGSILKKGGEAFTVCQVWFG